MAHPKVPIHPYIRRVDDRPSRGSLLGPGEVQGGNTVGIMLESALDTTKEGLASSVSLIDMSTSRASFRGASRVDVDYWNPSLALYSTKNRSLLYAQLWKFRSGLSYA